MAKNTAMQARSAYARLEISRDSITYSDTNPITQHTEARTQRAKRGRSMPIRPWVAKACNA